MAEKKASTKSKSSKPKMANVAIFDFEIPKPKLDVEKAEMIQKLCKDKGIERMMPRDLKQQAECFLDGVSFGKKDKSKKD